MKPYQTYVHRPPALSNLLPTFRVLCSTENTRYSLYNVLVDLTCELALALAVIRAVRPAPTCPGPLLDRLNDKCRLKVWTSGKTSGKTSFIKRLRSCYRVIKCFRRTIWLFGTIVRLLFAFCCRLHCSQAAHSDKVKQSLLLDRLTLNDKWRLKVWTAVKTLLRLRTLL